MNIIIRDASINDYEKLCEIYAELDRHHRLSHPELFVEPENYVRAKEYISKNINDCNKALFVAEADSMIAGFAECYVQKSSSFPVIKKREWVQLDNIAVLSEYQNSHIGTLLLNKVIEWANSKQIHRIELKVYSFNKSAIEFYSARNFTELNKTMCLDLS